MNALPVLDKKILAKLCSDLGEESADFLIKSLVKEIHNSEAVIVEYADTRNMHMLENQAHALKSAVRSFGALKLGADCLALEESAKAGKNASEIAKLIADFKFTAAETLKVFANL